MQAGYPVDLVFDLTLDAINGIPGRSVSGPHVRPASPEYMRIVQILRKAQLSGSVGMRIEVGKDKTQALFMFFRDPDIDPVLAAELADVRRLLRVDPDQRDVRVVFGVAPYDYEPGIFTSGVSYAEVQDYLDRIPCASVVIFDTCHSGAAAGSYDDDPDETIKTLKQTVRDARGRTAVMTACDTNQKANETERWKHGALTLAVLEGMRGNYLYSNAKQPLPEIDFPKAAPDGRIFLDELNRYVNQRVTTLCKGEIADLANKLQRTRTFCTGNITLEQIPIAAAAHRRE